MAYGDNIATPQLSQQVIYVLSQAEYQKYGVWSVTATIVFIHTATCVDLQATFTTKGQNPGQSVTLTPLNVTYDSGGFAQRAWYGALGAPVPGGSPW